MGNRCVIAAADQPQVGLYLHWNGGPESVLAFLEAAQTLHVRSPGSDPSYFLARLTQIIANWFGGTLSVGLGLVDYLDASDNGVYYVEGDFAVARRSVEGPCSVAELDSRQTAMYAGILAECLAANAEPFLRGQEVRS